ncbi:hypothetical protein BH20ACT4_BH20ACT4_05890 [soil metagenome]
MHHVIVRVWLPDRPGALGQVASRIGAVRGDVIGLEILERGAGRAIDELVVALHSANHVALLIDEINHVDGVSVEHVRPIEGERTEPGLAALSLAASVAEAPPAQRLQCLVDGLVRSAEVDWAVACGDGVILAACGEPPAAEWILAYIEGSGHLAELPHVNGADVLLARMVTSSITVAAGRPDRPVHESEHIRMSLVVRIADALID